MSAPSSELVHAYRMAREGSSRRGEMDVSRLPRLLPLLSSDQGAVRFELDFDLDSQSRPRVTGQIQASIEVICQRCLEPMTVNLEIDVRLGIVPSDEEAVALSKELEPLTLQDETLSLVTLVEDELILGLPAAPVHPAGRCQPPGKGRGTEGADGSGVFSQNERQPGKGTGSGE